MYYIGLNDFSAFLDNIFFIPSLDPGSNTDHSVVINPKTDLAKYLVRPRTDPDSNAGSSK